MTRNETVIFRVTKSEKEMIEKMAVGKYMPVSVLVREIVLSKLNENKEENWYGNENYRWKRII